MPNWARRRWSSRTTQPLPPWPTAWSTWATEPSSAWSAMRTACRRRSCRGDVVHRQANVKALDRKLLRDLRRMWSQALTIALVVASGLGGFVSSLSAVDSLALARERFYAQGHFADAFAVVKRAPLALAEGVRGGGAGARVFARGVCARGWGCRAQAGAAGAGRGAARRARCGRCADHGGAGGARGDGRAGPPDHRPADWRGPA